MKVDFGGIGLSKFLDDQGKLFGLINPVDLVILMILLVLGIKVISDYRPEPLKLRENPVTYGLLVRDAPPYLAESIGVGQDLFLDQHHVYLGKIMVKKVQPAEILINAGGRVLATTSPRNFDLRIELKRGGRIIAGPSRSGVYFGKFPLRVGERLKVHTMYASITGEVEYLRIKGKADD
mgnify:FL=1